MESNKTKPIEKSIVRFVFLVFWAFLMIYQPPMPVSLIHMMTGVSLLYVVLFDRKKIKENLNLWVAFLVMFLFLGFIILISGYPISNASHLFWLFMCILPSAAVFSSVAEKGEKSLDYLFHILLVASLIQATIAFMCLLYSPIQEIIFEYMVKNNLYTADHLEIWGYRIYGYGTSLMYAIPIVQGVIAAWSTIYSITNGKIRYFVFGVLILYSSVINAKIALPVFLVVLLLFFLFNLKTVGKRAIKIALIIVIFVYASSFVIDYLQQINPELYEWISIVFDTEQIREFYIEYYTMLQRWELPRGLDILFGTGAPRTSYGVDVDMGIVNDIWLGGLLYFAFTLAVVAYLAKRVSKNSYIPEIWRKFMPITFVAVFLLSDIKGSVFSYSAVMAFFMIIALYGSSKKDESIKSND